MQLFREFFWLIFPIMGMGMGAFAIWNEFSRQKKALDVLKIYAEKGVDPPESVIAVLNRASSAGGARAQSGMHPWSRFGFFTVMALGFGALTFWFSMGKVAETWVFTTGFGITAFVMAAVAVGALVQALILRGSGGR